MLRQMLPALACCAILSLTVESAVSSGPASVLYEWVSVEYDWPSDAAREAAIASGAFIPDNNVITGNY
jgi:hypothetical protein